MAAGRLPEKVSKYIYQNSTQTSIKMKYAGKAHEESVSTLGISGTKLSLFCTGCPLVLCLLETPKQTLTGCRTRSTGELKAQLAPSKPLCPHPGGAPRTGRTSIPRKISFAEFTTQVTCNSYLFKERSSLKVWSFSLSYFLHPSMESALDRGRPRERGEICDLSPKLKQNPIPLHAVSLTITIALVTMKSEIMPCNACLNNYNEWQLPESGFDSCRSRSSSVFSLGHPHPGVPHSPFFIAG